MEVGIVEGDFALEEPDEDDTAAVRRQVELAQTKLRDADAGVAARRAELEG
mgnify:CR=1 FL=1